MKEYKNFVDFASDYSTEDQCYAYLCEEKWGSGYICRRCGHGVHVKGRDQYYRRCQKCHYDESCTAHTLLHKLKFPVVKAFWICYQLSTMKKGLSTMEIARQYGIHQETAWFFKRKVQQAIDFKDEPMLVSNVEVDEFMIGGKEEGKPGRSHGKKAIVEVAIEIDYPEGDGKPKVKRAAARVIQDCSASELKKGLDQMVDQDAVVTTDQWSAYPKATVGRWHVAYPSKKGKNFELLHWHIFNLKNWLRGIHHNATHRHLQRYLNEYHFRFNRRNFTQGCTSTIMRRLVKSPWMPYKLAHAC